MRSKLIRLALAAAIVVLCAPAPASAAGASLECHFSGTAGNFQRLEDGTWGYGLDLPMDCAYARTSGEVVHTPARLWATGTFVRTTECLWIGTGHGTAGGISFSDSRVPDVDEFSYTLRTEAAAATFSFHQVEGQWLATMPVNPPGYPDSRRAGWAAAALFPRTNARSPCTLGAGPQVDMVGALTLAMP